MYLYLDITADDLYDLYDLYDMYSIYDTYDMAFMIRTIGLPSPLLSAARDLPNLFHRNFNKNTMSRMFYFLVGSVHY